MRATFAADEGIGASILIAGGLGEMAEGPAYGVLNLTFPKNLLVIVGKYDVLLNVTQLQAEELPLAFGTQEAVISGIVYGSFSSQTARKFVTPATTHLFEPVDASVITEIVWWMMHVFEPEEVSATRVKAHQIYLEREAALLVSLVGFLGIVLLAFFPVSHAARLEPGRGKVKKKHSVLRDWQIFAIWGVLGLALFLPMFFVGFAIPFPPLIFGASIAWWTLSVGIVGLLVLVGLLPRFSSVKVNLQAALVEALNWKHLGVALGLFLLMFVVASLLDGALNINLRIIAPLFQALTSTRRILAFLAFTPFFLIYFLVEGLYFHELHDWADQTPGFLSGVLNCGKVILGKVAPFVAVIGLQYVPIVLFNLWLFPSFVGFLVEFLWLITPIFIITTMCSWWFYKNTTSVWFGALFNGLMMAWVASTSFPF